MTKKQHGGKRNNAGRKPKYDELCKRVNVPLSAIPIVKDMLQHHKPTNPQTLPYHPNIIQLKPAEGVPSIPVALSRIPAGFPSPAADFIENRLDMNDLIMHPSSTFGWRVSGESMIDENIAPDDIVLVDRSLEPQHNDIVIADIGAEQTIKKLYKRHGRIELHPANPEYDIITFNAESELIIWGVVVCVIRKTR